MAQEAVEFIRNTRDTNSLAGTTWLTGVADQAGDPCYPGKACSVDVITNKLNSCPSGSGSCANLIQDSSSSCALFFNSDNFGADTLDIEYESIYQAFYL